MITTSARPMTSMKGAGYKKASSTSLSASASASTSGAFDPLGLNRESAPPLAARLAVSPEQQVKQAECAVHSLIEKIAFVRREQKHSEALALAKEAAQTERAVQRLREKLHLSEQNNNELTFAVLLTLAIAYTRCSLFEEALQTYTLMLKQKNGTGTGSGGGGVARLRVNMGNLYFQQGKFAQAVKQYRMCMDTLPASFKQVKLKVQRNIALCFLKMGQFQDAIHALEGIMDAPVSSSSVLTFMQPRSNRNGKQVLNAIGTNGGTGDLQSGFDLIICYYALGDNEKMKKGFTTLLQTPELLSLNEEEEQDDIEIETMIGNTNGENNSVQSDAAAEALPFNDGLCHDLRARQKKLQRTLLTAARLIAPHIEPSASEGYDWVIEALRQPKHRGSSAHRPHNNNNSDNHVFDDLQATKPGFPVTAMHLLLAKGIAYIQSSNLSAAIEVFRSFHHTYSLTQSGAASSASTYSKKHDSSSDHLIDHAATNLSFLYFLEGDHSAASTYADLAVKHDRYNAKALVNKANVLFASGNLEGAKELYLESIGVEADCCEAIYNLGIVNQKLNQPSESLQAFRKLHKLCPYDREVLWQLGRAHEITGQFEDAIHYYYTLNSALPSDPALLAKLGSLYASTGDETAAFHCYHDSHELYPLSMNVLSWLGVWFVKNEMFDEAIQYFEHADLLESPGSSQNCKWKLMIASCFRRLGDRHKAQKLYEAILKIDNDNVEAIKYLMALAKESGNIRDLELWSERLFRLEKNSKVQQDKDSSHERMSTRGVKSHINEERRSVDLFTKPPTTSPRLSPRRSSPHLTNPAKVDTSFKHDLGPEDTRKTINTGATRNVEDEWGDDALADDLLPL